MVRSRHQPTPVTALTSTAGSIPASVSAAACDFELADPARPGTCSVAHIHAVCAVAGSEFSSVTGCPKDLKNFSTNLACVSRPG